MQVQLFHREHTKLTITEVGKQYYVMAKKLLEQVEDQKREIRSISNNKKVRLVIALSSALTSTTILKIVHDFMATYTNYEIEIIMQETNNVDTLLKNQDIDVVVSLKRTKSKELHSEQIFRAPIKLVYSLKATLEGDTADQ